MKNVAGYDLQKLATGALGTLGVITRATFRVHPLPKQSRTLTIGAASMADLMPSLVAIQDSALAQVALQVRARQGAPPEMDVLLEDVGIAAQHAGSTLAGIGRRGRRVGCARRPTASAAVSVVKAPRRPRSWPGRSTMWHWTAAMTCGGLRATGSATCGSKAQPKQWRRLPPCGVS